MTSTPTSDALPRPQVLGSLHREVFLHAITKLKGGYVAFFANSPTVINATFDGHVNSPAFRGTVQIPGFIGENCKSFQNLPRQGKDLTPPVLAVVRYSSGARSRCRWIAGSKHPNLRKPPVHFPEYLLALPELEPSAPQLPRCKRCEQPRHVQLLMGRVSGASTRLLSFEVAISPLLRSAATPGSGNQHLPYGTGQPPFSAASVRSGNPYAGLQPPGILMAPRSRSADGRPATTSTAHPRSEASTRGWSPRLSSLVPAKMHLTVGDTAANSIFRQAAPSLPGVRSVSQPPPSRPAAAPGPDHHRNRSAVRTGPPRPPVSDSLRKIIQDARQILPAPLSPPTRKNYRTRYTDKEQGTDAETLRTLRKAGKGFSFPGRRAMTGVYRPNKSS